MTFRTNAPPDPIRADAGAAVFGTWRVGTPDRQRAVADAVADAWDRRPWPSPSLVASTLLAGTDGDTLVFYTQVTGPDAFREAPQDPTWKDEVDAAVPGIDRVGVLGCVRYRSKVDDAGTVPGCVVLVTRRLAEPDPAAARRLVDEQLDQPGDDTAVPGLLAVHFYVSADGGTLLNYAEWSSVDEHRAMAGDSPAPADGVTVARFQPLLQLAPSPG